MDLDTLHNWLMFRPLMVFILACPFLLLPLVISWWKDRRTTRRSEEAKPDRASQVDHITRALGRDETGTFAEQKVPSSRRSTGSEITDHNHRRVESRAVTRAEPELLN